MNSHPRPNALARVGLRIKRAVTFVYGPAEIRESVDPVAEIDRELGDRPAPRQATELTERQQSYENLPRSAAE